MIGKFTVQCERGGHLTISVSTESLEPPFEYIKARAAIVAGGFHGSVRGELETDDLVRFYQDFIELQKSLRGEIQLDSREGWLKIHVVADGLGHFIFDCTIAEFPSYDNTLQCRLETDQTFTRHTLDELDSIVQKILIADLGV